MLRSLLFFAAALSISLAACNTPNPNSANVAANSNAKKDSAAAKADEDLTPAQRATKASKKYRFDEKEAFDRCSPVEMLYKNGTKVELPASALEYLKCANEIELRNDRFFVYDDAKGFYVYDLEKKNSLVVFSKNDGVQYYSMAWSPSGHKQIVLCINYGDAAKLKKEGYAYKTRLMVLEYDADFTKVLSKHKLDTPFCAIETEGKPLVQPAGCHFTDEDNIQINRTVCDTISNIDRLPQHLEKISIASMK